MKKLLLLVLVFLCAVHVPALAGSVYIPDPAGLFGGEGRKELAETCASFEESFGVFFRAATSSDPLSVPIEQHAKEIFDTAYGNTASGALYLIDAHTLSHTVHLSGDLAEHLPSETVEEAMRLAEKSFDKGEYAEAAMDAIVYIVISWMEHLDEANHQAETEASAEELSAKTEEVTALVKEHFQTLLRVEQSQLEQAVEARKGKKELLLELYNFMDDAVANLQQYQTQIVQLLAE